MKTLYISDLDGTFLNSRAEISEFSKSELRRLIAKGANITFATARTAATCVKMFEDIDLKLPVALMNGVAVYDMARKRYEKVEYIDESAKARLVSVIKKYGLEGFMYAVDERGLTAYYSKEDTEATKIFIEERVRKFGKYFTRVDDFTVCADEKIAYYSISCPKEVLEPALAELAPEQNLHADFYHDNYHPAYWYMEVCSNKASKGGAVRYLREKYGFGRVVGFGDNLNDISLFKACDECYAVENAKSELKKTAKEVILSNDEDGVIKTIVRLYS